MSLVERMIGAAKLDANVYEQVEADQNATGQAATVVLVSSLAAGIGALSSGFMAVVLSLFGALIGWVIWAVLIWVIGTKLMPEPQTDADVGQLLRTLGFATSPGVLRVAGVIPILGPVVSLAVTIWMLVAMVVATRQALDYSSTGRAVIVCVLAWIPFFLISIAIGVMVGVGAALTG